MHFSSRSIFAQNNLDISQELSGIEVYPISGIITAFEKNVKHVGTDM